MTEQEARLKFAASDMRKARRESEILIAQTVRGLVALAYDADTKTYEIRQQQAPGQTGNSVIFSGKAKAAKAAVARLYRVA